MTTPTDTPRTDEQIWTTDFDHQYCDVVDMEFARELERELAASKAEVERLKANLRRAIEIAEIYSVHLIYPTLEQEISTLKATLNHTQK